MAPENCCQISRVAVAITTPAVAELSFLVGCYWIRTRTPRQIPTQIATAPRAEAPALFFDAGS
jgi:hypothetical protein